MGLDTGGFDSGIKKASKQGGTLASTLKNGIGGAATFVGNRVSAVTVMMGNLMADAVKSGVNMVKQVGKIGIDYNSQMETYVTNFRTMLGGSSEAAEQLTSDLEDMAASTPFAMSNLADATQTLLAFGQDSSTVLDTLQSLGDISMGDANKLQSLTLAFAQASSSGKLMGQDLMQMINAGFNPLQTIVDQTGVSMADLKDFMSDGKASSDLRKQMNIAKREVKALGDEASDGAKMLVQMSQDGAISAELLGQIFDIETSPGGKFYNAMENASKTYEGMVSTLQDDSAALMGKVFRPISDWMTDDLLPNAISAISEISSAYDEGGLSAAMSKATQLAGEYLSELGTKALETGSNILANILSGITGDQVSGTEISAALSGLWTDATAAADSFVSTAGGVLNGIWDGISGDTENKTSITEEIGAIWDIASESLSGFTDAAGNLLGTIYEGISGQEATAENIGNTIGGLFSAGGTAITNLLDSASSLFSDISENLGDPDKSISEKITGIFAAGGDAMGGLIDSASTFFTDLYNAITGDTDGEQKLNQFMQDLFDVDIPAKQAELAVKLGMTPQEVDAAGIEAATTYTHDFGYTAPPQDANYEAALARARELAGISKGEGGDSALDALSSAVADLQSVIETLPGEAASAAISGLSGAKVEMDGTVVGELVIPLVTAAMGRMGRIATKAYSADR